MGANYRWSVVSLFLLLVWSGTVATALVPTLSLCGRGPQFCCNLVHPGVVATLWLKNETIYLRVPGNATFLNFTEEGSLRCAVELVDSVTKWSSLLIKNSSLILAGDNQTAEVSPGSDIAEFRFNIELADLVRTDQIEYIRMLIYYDSCESGPFNLFWNIFQVEQRVLEDNGVEVLIENFSVRLNYTKYASNLPVCVRCEIKLKDTPKYAEKIILANATIIPELRICPNRTEGTKQYFFEVQFTRRNCKNFEKGELISYYISSSTCLENASVSQVTCWKDEERTAYLVIASSVPVHEAILSKVLEGIASVTAINEDLPTTSHPITSPEPTINIPRTGCTMGLTLYLSIGLCILGITLLLAAIVILFIRYRKLKKAKSFSSTTVPSSQLTDPLHIPSIAPPTTTPSAVQTDQSLGTLCSQVSEEEDTSNRLSTTLSSTGELYEGGKRRSHQSLRQRRVYPQQVTTPEDEGHTEGLAQLTLPSSNSNSCRTIQPHIARYRDLESRITSESVRTPSQFNQPGDPVNVYIFTQGSPSCYDSGAGGLTSEPHNHTSELSTCGSAVTTTVGVPPQDSSPVRTGPIGLPAENLSSTSAITSVEIPPHLLQTSAKNTGTPFQPIAGNIPSQSFTSADQSRHGVHNDTTPTTMPADSRTHSSWIIPQTSNHVASINGTMGTLPEHTVLPDIRTPSFVGQAHYTTTEQIGQSVLVYAPYHLVNASGNYHFIIPTPVSCVPQQLIPSVSPTLTSAQQSGAAEMVPPSPARCPLPPQLHHNVMAPQLESDSKL